MGAPHEDKSFTPLSPILQPTTLAIFSPRVAIVSSLHDFREGEESYLEEFSKIRNRPRDRLVVSSSRYNS